MNVLVIPRTALTGYLKLVRTPLDSAIGLLPGNGNGPKPAAQLAVDRADATIRFMAGAILRDPVLREDGQRRREAADERARAVRLRTRQEQTAQTADARLEQREEQASKQRQQARETANARRRQAESQAQKEKQQAAKTESRRRDASRKAAAKREEALEQRAPREELQSMQAQNQALRSREAELAARDEARRLADAASAVRAERKSDTDS
jgi:hypothetical protein